MHRSSQLAALVAAAGLLGGAAGSAHAAQKVTPDVSGTQRVLSVGCRFADTSFPDILNYSNDGINNVLNRTHDYFDQVSNGRVDLKTDFAGWYSLPKSSGDYSDSNGDEQTKDCQDIASDVLAKRGEQATDYRAVVMLFNLDRGISNQEGTGDGRPGTWVRLRFTGGVGGGWTSEAVWAHELGHAFGLLHSTFPNRAPGNQYNDFQDAMSGYAHPSQRRWNFLAGGVCNGIFLHPRCIYAGEADNIPVHYSAFQKQRLGWLDADQMVTHYGGSADYQLSAPTYNPQRLPTVEKLKLVEVPIPNSSAYYAIEYRRGDDGDASNASAYRRGWDPREKGIGSDRVTVYKVEPDLYAANAGDLGDANLDAVLKPGESFSEPGLAVAFNSVEPGPRMNAFVRVATPPTAAPQTFLAAAQGRGGSWADQDVDAQLISSPVNGGAPVAHTFYGVDRPGCDPQHQMNCATYDKAFTIAGEGEHEVRWFSVDSTGHAEDLQRDIVRIDATAPQTTATVDGGKVTLQATDARSGVSETDYDLDGDGFKPYRDPVVVTGAGSHTLRFRSVDNAGNYETPQSVPVEIAAPATPAPGGGDEPAPPAPPAPGGGDQPAPPSPPAPPASPDAPHGGGTTALRCKLTVSPRRIRRADGRLVLVTVRVQGAAGLRLRLVQVRSTRGGKAAGWRTGTADRRGRLRATRGARYRIDYRVSDAAGRSAIRSARVSVSR